MENTQKKDTRQYKSICLSCGKEWFYSKSDLKRSELNQSINETPDLFKTKNKRELPEVAHQCPACSSKSVSLQVIGEKPKLMSESLLKFIILISALLIVVIVVIVVAICATVALTNRTASDAEKAQIEQEVQQVQADEEKTWEDKFNEVMNEASKKADKAVEDASNKLNEALSETQTEKEPIKQADNTNSVAPTNSTCLIGADKANVRKLLKKYKETKSFMSDNALDFEDKNLLITVYFNSKDIADGVLFMQNSLDGIDTITGAGSYVGRHYNELVNLATTDKSIKVETDVTKYNSQGKKTTPMEIYVGNVIH